MALVQVNVNSGGGADYSSLQGALDDWDTPADAGDDYEITVESALTEDVETAIVEGSGLNSVIIKGNTSDYALFPVLTGGIFVNSNDVLVTIEDLEITGGFLDGSVLFGIYGNAGVTDRLMFVNRCIVRDINATSLQDVNVYGIGYGSLGGDITNCIAYNLTRDVGGSGSGKTMYAFLHAASNSITCGVYNCIADSIQGGSDFGVTRGFRFTNHASNIAKNCVATDVTGVGNNTNVRGIQINFTPNNCDYEYCGSDDGTAVGTGSFTADRDTDYEDADGRNYLSAAGSALLAAGLDLGNVDAKLSLNNQDRNALAVTWDAGCFQSVAAGGVTIPVLQHSYRQRRF